MIFWLMSLKLSRLIKTISDYDRTWPSGKRRRRWICIRLHARNHSRNLSTWNVVQFFISMLYWVRKWVCTFKTILMFASGFWLNGYMDHLEAFHLSKEQCVLPLFMKISKKMCIIDNLKIFFKMVHVELKLCRCVMMKNKLVNTLKTIFLPKQ